MLQKDQRQKDTLFYCYPILKDRLDSAGSSSSEESLLSKEEELEAESRIQETLEPWKKFEGVWGVIK